MSTSPGGSVYRSPGLALRGTGNSMPHIVRRYHSKEDYLDPTITGTPVSDELKTWEEAERVRDVFRKGTPRYYFNITHSTLCAVVTRENKDVR